MNRRDFITTLAGIFATPAAAQNFEAIWQDRFALSVLPPATAFDEKAFTRDIRERTLTPPPPVTGDEPKREKRRFRRRRFTWRRRRRAAT